MITVGPHKPGIKFDAQITTEIKPVFNGSLKNKESYSLNEPAYQRIIFLSDIQYENREPN